MKKILLPLCLPLFSAPALAGADDIVNANNQFEIQRISTHVEYTETGSGLFGTRKGILDTETGPVPGFGIASSRMKGPGNSYVHFEFSMLNGSTKYTGSLQGGTFGSVISSSSASLMDFSARFGSGYALRAPAMLTPFFELGRHQWDRGVNYGETYTHNYFGLGVLGQYSPVNQLVLSAQVFAGRTFWSSISVNSGPGVYGFSDSLGDSMLSRYGLAADYAFTRKIHASIGIDYTRFQYGISPVQFVGNAATWEPDSKTRYTTLRIGLGYRFN